MRIYRQHKPKKNISEFGKVTVKISKPSDTPLKGNTMYLLIEVSDTQKRYIGNVSIFIYKDGDTEPTIQKYIRNVNTGFYAGVFKEKRYKTLETTIKWDGKDKIVSFYMAKE